MPNLSFQRLVLLAITFPIIFCACRSGNGKAADKNFNYENFKNSVVKHDTSTYDTSNVFDDMEYTPGVDSLDSLLSKVDTIMQTDANMMAQLDTVMKGIKNQNGFSADEKLALKENISTLDSFFKSRNEDSTGTCKGKACFIYAEIQKSNQTLYLYISGELKDSFKVSTGIKGRETPAMDVQPRGPIFIKYKSKKYPGGNYMGLGNMPYAVFVRGGYAIHGTTPGNFSKLGTKASHGCIRLHPDNARLFYELVKMAGLRQTWVKIME